MCAAPLSSAVCAVTRAILDDTVRSTSHQERHDERSHFISRAFFCVPRVKNEHLLRRVAVSKSREAGWRTDSESRCATPSHRRQAKDSEPRELVTRKRDFFFTGICLEDWHDGP